MENLRLVVAVIFVCAGIVTSLTLMGWVTVRPVCTMFASRAQRRKELVVWWALGGGSAGFVMLGLLTIWAPVSWWVWVVGA